MHARYYSPRWGRFLNVDPIRPAVTSPEDWNRYAYVANNPMQFTDPGGTLRLKASQVGIDLWESADQGMDVPALEFTIERASIAPKARGGLALAITAVNLAVKSTATNIMSGVSRMLNVGQTTEFLHDKSDAVLGVGFVETEEADSELEEAFFERYFEKAGDLSRATSGKPERVRVSGRNIFLFQEAVDEVLREALDRGDLTQDQYEELKANYDIVDLAREAAENPADRDLVRGRLDGTPSYLIRH
jgi:hypothetical protein